MTHRAIEGREWLETDGGPFLLAPVSLLPTWTGYEGDYDLVIEGTDAGRSECYLLPGRNVVVLGDEPLASTVLESRSLIVQWVHANSEDEMRAHASEVDLDSIVWREGPVLESDGSLALMDAALPGAEATEDDLFVLESEAGAYRIDSAEVPLAPHCAARLHRLVPVKAG
ncbi:Imm21 family immunity protein [Streptomyces sp. 11x1]|uniref:Imm21 family immunity protein n=1 Tax=Streptomyces sp. 11x1 TaxID=3038642 RepID=UPI00292E539A|nr:Imm21 family immunity protein [Streptomyces sp. 11x1]WNZ09167.1 Imm21 family immunity protein [Streptomyces sp. 11x1]